MSEDSERLSRPDSALSQSPIRNRHFPWTCYRKNMLRMQQTHTHTQLAALKFTPVCLLQGELWSCDAFLKTPRSSHSADVEAVTQKSLAAPFSSPKTKTSTAVTGGGWRGGAGVRGQRAHVPGKSRPRTFCRLVLIVGPSQDSVTTGMSVKTNNPHFMFHCKVCCKSSRKLLRVAS